MLLDLKYLLIEAKQRLPLVLQTIEGPEDHLLAAGGKRGCTFCGGLGHTASSCPKLDTQSRKLTQGMREFLRE